MAGLYELVKRFIAPYYSTYVYVLIFIIFAVAAYYIYNAYAPKESSVLDEIHQPRDNVNTTGGDSAGTQAKILNVYFFTADWCPHCRTAKPEIDKFETSYKNDNIRIYRIDCTNSDEPDVAKQIDDFGVTSYPTVKIKDSDGNTFEFDAKITYENLVGFVESVASK